LITSVEEAAASVAASTSSRTTAGTRSNGRSSTRPWRGTPPRRCGRWRPRTTSRRSAPWWTWAAGGAAALSLEQAAAEALREAPEGPGTA
jgi:hypothetical protein